MKKHEIFLNDCNKLTRILIHMYHLKPNATMGFAIRATRYKNPVIKAHYETLIAYIELRNILVHETFGYVLAEPTDDVMNLLKHILSKLETPMLVKDMFLFDIKSVNVNDALSDVLNIIKHNGYTHFPVFEGERCIGLLTDNGITHFLANHVEQDLISIQETTVRDVFDSDEHHHDFTWVRPEATLYDVVDIFDSKQHHVRAALVTRSKEVNHPKDIIGMILPKDVALFFDELL
jgi:predicted transcriptional regulator